MCSIISLDAGSTHVVARTMDFEDTIVGKRSAVYKQGDKIQMYVGKSFTVATGVVKMICNFPLNDDEKADSYFGASEDEDAADNTDTLGINIPQVTMQQGVNGKGLAFGLLYNLDNSMGPRSDNGGDLFAFPIEMLATKATIGDVEAAIKALPGTWYNPLGTGATVHYWFSDTSGKQLIVEFKGGVPAMTITTAGVMTNAPVYPWHLTNVRNYLNCNPVGVDKSTLNGEEYSMIGHGDGQMGIPGDMGSPSRFIRLFYNRAWMKSVTVDNVFQKAIKLIGLAHSSYGTNSGHGVNPEDFTLWTAVSSFDGKDARLWVQRWNDAGPAGMNFVEVV